MAKIKILDTGYVSATSVGDQTQLPVASRAGNTGSSTVTSFTLETTSISFSRGANIEQTTLLDADDNTPSTLSSVKSQRLTINFTLYKNITTSGFNVNDIVQFVRLELTDGLKLLYPQTVDEVAGFKTLVEALGAVNIGGDFSDASPTDTSGKIGQTIPYLVGRVNKLSISDSNNSKYWAGSFEFSVTG